MALVLASPMWTSPWEWTASDWAGLTFLFVALAALVAAWQAREARRLREAQARPFVIIDFHPWSTIIELRIKNIGTTLARDVRFEFRPPLTTTHDESPGRGNLMELNLFKNGIPTLAPHREIKLFFDQFPARVGAALPMTYDVTISYRGNGRKRLTDETVLDLDMYRGTGGITRHDIHDVHKRLKEISDNIKKWTDFSGLKILTPADMERRWNSYRHDDDEADAVASRAAPDDLASPGASETPTEDSSA